MPKSTKNISGGLSAGQTNRRSPGVRYNSRVDWLHNLKQDIDRGVKYFWSKRPLIDRP